jgi:hypothetical protein
MNEHRQTGRTTRMLQGALDELRAGERIAVVIANPDHLRYIPRMLRDLGATREEADRVTFLPADCDSTDRVRGLEFSAVHVDHAAIEEPRTWVWRVIDAARSRIRPRVPTVTNSW